MIPEELNNGTIEKALRINLDPQAYGTIAEIGAGQEVARNFFVAGAAAGTVAKTMSAYDMQFSDAIYGKEENNRYVSQSRVNKMLNREYSLVVERLEYHRPEETMFFSFADTVSARGYKSDRDCHGWMGIKFQSTPMGEANKIVLHVRMKDSTNIQQQEALGRLGINLIYAAYYYRESPEQAIESLLDNLSTDRIEINMVKFDGPSFKDVDNRLLALHLVQSGLTHSIFFTKKGEPIEGSDLLYKKNILLLRGSFRPFTKVHSDILKCAKDELLVNQSFQKSELVILPELSMSHLLSFGGLDKSDFLGRIDTLNTMGFDVQISNFAGFHELKENLTQFTKGNISIALGIKNISQIFSHCLYADLKGGLIEGLGILFSGNTQLLVYPKLLKDGVIRKVNEMVFEEDVMHLFQHFLCTTRLIPLTKNKVGVLSFFTKDIRKGMTSRSEDWEKKVPEKVLRIIKQKKLFGYK